MMVKLTLDQAIEVYTRMKKGDRKCFLSEEYNVSVSTLYTIERCEERWSCLKKLIT